VMKHIEKCSAVAGCGLVFGYDLPDGGEVCWLHAEKQELPAHRQFLFGLNSFLKDFQKNFQRTATKRDSYGLVGTKS